MTNRRLVKLRSVAERVAVVRERKARVAFRGGFVRFLNVKVTRAFALRDAGNSRLNLNDAVRLRTFDGEIAKERFRRIAAGERVLRNAELLDFTNHRFGASRLTVSGERSRFLELRLNRRNLTLRGF